MTVLTVSGGLVVSAVDTARLVATTAVASSRAAAVKATAE